MAKKSNSGKATYGPTLGTAEAEKFAIMIFKASRFEKSQGRKGIPVCAWGGAGIGKTELPKQIAKETARDMFDGNIVYVPLGQIEEKAELQGLPDIQTTYKVIPEDVDHSTVIGKIEKKGLEETYVDEKGETKTKIVDRYVVVDARTIYATPSWIPQAETHGERGILVIDDMNRADSRILNSVMQLLQDAELLGWSLPAGWEIYCTANPDDGKYQVTSLDDAQMTRMANFVQTFDEKSWAANWAEPTGLHPLAINFMLTYKEMAATGERTNPRSWDKFFRICHNLFDDAQANKNTIETIGLMNVDSVPLATFISFITDGFGKLPDVEDILHGKVDLEDFGKLITQNGSPRTDITSALCVRIINYVTKKYPGRITDQEVIKGIQTWFTQKFVSRDIVYKYMSELVRKDLRVSNSEISAIVMGALKMDK